VKTRNRENQENQENQEIKKLNDKCAGERGVSRYERNPSNQVDLHWYVGFLAQRPLISLSYTPFFALVNIRFNYIH